MREIPVFLFLLVPLCAAAQTAADADRLLTSQPQEVYGSAQPAPPEENQTSLADKRSMELREASAVVTVLSAADLAAAGVRDIQEAVQLLPGITLGRDVDDVVSVGIRGNWASEAKCLIMVNGIPINEHAFGSMALAQRFPMAAVSRIEFIAGPGSVQYGGAAALGVINIVTKDAAHDEGFMLGGNTGIANDAVTRKDIWIQGSKRLGTGAEIQFAGSIHVGVRATETRALPTGDLLSYKDSTRQLATDFWLRFTKGRFTSDLLYDDLHFDVSDRPYEVIMRNVAVKEAWKQPLGRAGGLEAYAGYRYQLPWVNLNNVPEGLIISNTIDERLMGGAAWNWAPGDVINVRVGCDAYTESSHFYYYRRELVFTINDRPHVTLGDVAGYAEVTAHGKWGKLTGGYRMEHSSLSGTFTAPRICYTRSFGHLHLKALYSEAFKVPTIQNLNLGPVGAPLTGERATAMEAELGWTFDRHMQVSVNAFNDALNNPIVYVYDPSNSTDNYLNRERAGTYGLEGRFSYHGDRWLVLVAYSDYTAKRDTRLPEIQLPDSLSRQYQGLPRRKITAVGSVKCGRHLEPGINLVYLSRAYAYQLTDAGDDALSLLSFAPVFLVNVGVRWTFLSSQGVQLRLGCNNVLDSKASILSPYANGMVPLPYEGRELTIGITYRVPW